LPVRNVSKDNRKSKRNLMAQSCARGVRQANLFDFAVLDALVSGIFGLDLAGRRGSRTRRRRGACAAEAAGTRQKEEGELPELNFLTIPAEMVRES
jgi:hypothetical protein